VLEQPSPGTVLGVESLKVRCVACKRPFGAGLQVDRASLEAMVISCTYRCPHCGHEAVYTKADHFPVLECPELVHPPSPGDAPDVDPLGSRRRSAWSGDG